LNSECFDKERKKLAQFASSTPSNKQLFKAHNRKSVLDLVMMTTTQRCHQPLQVSQKQTIQYASV